MTGRSIKSFSRVAQTDKLVKYTNHLLSSLIIIYSYEKKNRPNKQN